MSYRIEELIAVRGRVKIWRSITGCGSLSSRDKAVSWAAAIRRTGPESSPFVAGLGRIRIRRNRTTPKPKGGDTK